MFGIAAAAHRSDRDETPWMSAVWAGSWRYRHTDRLKLLSLPCAF
jgi:hypothetical protein